VLTDAFNVSPKARPSFCYLAHQLHF